MKKTEMIVRNMIIQTFIDKLKPLDFVHAFYEGGAAAFNRIDEWLDLSFIKD